MELSIGNMAFLIIIMYEVFKHGKYTTKVKKEKICLYVCMKNIKIPILSKITQSMCCIPNSNADCERVFSLVRKIQTEQRASMDNQTLCSLLCAKINCQEECHQVKPSKDTLKLTKSAAYNYNKEH